jgi:hypothetical protein
LIEMTRTAIALLTAALLLAAPNAGAQTAEPEILVCQVSHHEASGQARYRLTVNWNGMQPGAFARIDLAARDGSDATWLQFHSDTRLRPGRRPTILDFYVSDNSQYPLEFFLVGMTAQVARDFDNDCRRGGFCSLKLPMDGVTELDNALDRGVQVSSPYEALPC